MASMASLSDFTRLRDQAVFIGMLSRAASVEEIEAWVQQSERALSVGPYVDPTLAIQAGDELGLQVRYMRAFLAFRREVEAIVTAGYPALHGDQGPVTE
jgi:hypothetical protein